MIKTFLQICIVCLIMVTAKAYAGGYHHHYEPPVIENTTNVYETYETYEVTETVYATDEQVAQALETASPSVTYSPDRCQGVPEAQAAANNQMHLGSSAPQLSLGAGVCSENWATNLQFGMKINSKMFVNGSWGHNWSHENHSAGVGLLVLFK